jgi:transposase
MSVPGIGPMTASAMVAAIGDGAAFSKGRDFAAWLGLVPKQISTGTAVTKSGTIAADIASRAHHAPGICLARISRTRTPMLR